MPQRKSKVVTELDTASYKQFVTGLNLVALSLKKSESLLEREKYFDALDSKENLTKEVSGVFELEDSGVDFFDASADYTLRVSAGNQVPVLTLSCCFEAHFHVASGARQELMKRFAESDVNLIVWPYFRQFVSDMTSRMAIPPLTVPLSTSSVGAKYQI